MSRHGYKPPRGRHSAPVPIQRTKRTRASAALGALVLTLVGMAPGLAIAAERYEVAPGDTLASIAAKFGYTNDNAWRRVYNANPKIDNPDLIIPGQKLTIPERGERVKKRRLPQTHTAPAAPRRAKTTVSRSAPAPAAAPSTSVWTQLAACESGGNWAANTGNGYYGGLQFSLSSWRAVGGTGYPHHASAATQIAMGQRLQGSQGWGAWPGCAAKLGLY